MPPRRKAEGAKNSGHCPNPEAATTFTAAISDIFLAQEVIQPDIVSHRGPSAKHLDGRPQAEEQTHDQRPQWPQGPAPPQSP